MHTLDGISDRGSSCTNLGNLICSRRVSTSTGISLKTSSSSNGPVTFKFVNSVLVNLGTYRMDSKVSRRVHYRTRTVLGPLDPGLNAIIGRNGAGKSNFFAGIELMFSKEEN